MPRGYPDYQNPVNQVAGRLVDFAGIQSAILRLSTLDGLGRLVWAETFNEGSKAWAMSHTVSAEDPTITDTFAEVPPCCLRMNTVGAIVGRYSMAARSLMYTVPQSFGLEWSTLYNQGDNTMNVAASAVLAGIAYQTTVTYAPASGQIGIIVADGTHILDTIPPSSAIPLWIPFKVVLNFATPALMRLLVGIRVFSLVDYAYITGPSADADHIEIIFTSLSSGAGSLDQYIGHVYLTADEP